MQNVLVTGANGFIGQPLVRALRKAGYQVLELKRADGDIADPATLLAYQHKTIDFAFHLAARTVVPDSWGEPADFQRVNVTGTSNILELCRTRNIPLTYVSAYLYGIPHTLPVGEDDELVPNNPYAMSKTLAESLCKFYAAHFGVPVTIIRPFNIYGPRQRTPFLIPEIIEQVNGRCLIRLKDLMPRRDYLYVGDLIDALMLTLNPTPGCRVYNIGHGSSLSVSEVAEIIQSVMGTSLPVISDNLPRQNEIPDVYANISKAERELHWRPRHSFEDGIKKMISMEQEP
jgi:nucleoside-diphosphate-sugar epimerase